MTEQMDGQMSLSDLVSLFGKMSAEHSVPTKAETSKPSSRKSSGSSSRMQMMCLCLRKESGPTPDAFMTTWGGGQLHGEYTTRSTGDQPSTLMTECAYSAEPHRDVSVSRLSQILEDSPPRKYCLSEKACLGILTRAARRGKTLPPELKAALEAQSVSRNEPENQGGKGILIQEEHVGALSTLNNQSVLDRPIPIHDKATRFQGGGKGRHNDGGGNGFGVGRPDDPTWALSTAERHSVFAVEGNGSRESHKGPGYAETETMYTLNAVEQHGECRSKNF